MLSRTRGHHTESVTTCRLPDPERERRPVAAPELRMGGVQREAPATNVATM
jgi:hypothetical protein